MNEEDVSQELWNEMGKWGYNFGSMTVTDCQKIVRFIADRL